MTTNKQRLTQLQRRITPDDGQQVIINWQTGNHPGDYYNTASKQWLTPHEYQALQGDLLTVIVRYADKEAC